MHRFQFSLGHLLMVGVPIAAAVAAVARDAASWGPTNLVVLAGLVLIAAAILCCVPAIPHRAFWVGLASYSCLYPAILWLLLAISGLSLEFPPINRGLAGWGYGADPSVVTAGIDRLGNVIQRQRLIDSHIVAAHAMTALCVGLLGGSALLILSKARESRRWARDAPPELPLEDFLLPPLRVDRPLDSK